jgi:phosphohistidine phosphatase
LPPLKQIHLLRHAKSSWKDPSLRDRERPLNGRGRRAAKAVARHLREEGIDPELVLCSPARRARETRRTVRIERDVYGAGAATLLELLRGLPDGVASVMVIGHNPGLEELALALARDGPLVGELAAKYPTGALATLTFEGRWADLALGRADLVAFVRPRDL